MSIGGWKEARFLVDSESDVRHFCCAFWTSFRHEIRWCFGAKELRFRKARWRLWSSLVAAAAAAAVAEVDCCVASFRFFF